MPGLADLARRLGLSLEVLGAFPPRVRVRGTLEGARVDLVSSGYAAEVSGWFPAPLDLGLDVSPVVPFTPVLRSRVLVGDGAWDDEIAAHADEPARAGELVTPELRAVVVRTNAASPFSMNDRRVQIRAMTFDDYEPAIRRAAAIVGAVEAARRSVPPAAGLAPLSEAWRALALTGRGQFEATPLRAWGTIEAVSFDARTARRGRLAYDVSLRVSLDEPPLAVPLSLRRETLSDKVSAVLGATDLQTGDAAFDRSFRIDSAAPELALLVLDPGVRRGLSELSERCERVALEGAVLTLGGDAARVAPDDLERALHLASALRDSLARVAAQSGSPYR